MNFQVDVLVSELQTIEICFVFEGDYSACVSVLFKTKQKNSQQKNLKTQSVTTTIKTLFSTFFTW